MLQTPIYNFLIKEINKPTLNKNVEKIKERIFFLTKETVQCFFLVC